MCVYTYVCNIAIVLFKYIQIYVIPNDSTRYLYVVNCKVLGEERPLMIARTPTMYVCIRVGHKAGPCTATFNDLLCFRTPTIPPLS
jgi:hypothetical protein